MISIIGYQILAKIKESHATTIYRARRDIDDQPVIIKVLNIKNSMPHELSQLQHSYEIAKDINIKGVVTHFHLEKDKETISLIMEDFSDITLETLILKGPFDRLLFLKIAIQLAETLDELYRHKIIHKDIKPQNILVNLDREQIKITDFGISSRLSLENPQFRNPNMLEGTLSYISPEQTGRMNRSIDYRTDYYSLGITFYQMLSGRLPFEGEDPIELIHCHIAKQPDAPHEINPDVPKVLSDIVMKLMSKNAESRYQTAYGLKADLLKCYNQIQENNTINDFEICLDDISDKFQIPQKLYGRKEEIDKLISAFERINSLTNNESGKAEIMLVSGYSGIGKSVLVHEIHKPIIRLRGYFTSGKFDQFKRNIPYSALIQAFSELVRQILTEKESLLLKWKDKFKNALGPNGQVIIDVIPALEQIIGKQNPVPVLSPVETQNRFNFVFQSFLHVFASKDHPLVVFLDDLQWADTASLNLLKNLLLDPDTKNILFIGAYRDNEVDQSHQLILTLEEIKKEGAKIGSIALNPLKLFHIEQILKDTLHKEKDEIMPLSNLVHSKTQGNPFFVNQFLTTLYNEKLITFIPPESSNNIKLDDEEQENIQWGWNWKLKQIQDRDITDNVIHLMENNIQKLSKNTQHALKMAASISNRFDLQTLSTIIEKKPIDTANDLWEAVEKGLILPISDIALTRLLSKFETDSKIDDKNDRELKIYKFLHDRVQQAAYSMIDNNEKPNVHLKIGRLLLNTMSEDEKHEKIFDLVNHLNIGKDLISDTSQRKELSKLNLIAGKKAMASTAYQPAFNYFKTGIDFLSKESWEIEYDMTLSLYVAGTEAAYMTGDIEIMEQLAEIVLEHAKDLLDKVKIYEVKIQAYTARSKHDKAIKTAITVLKLLGIKLPEKPGKLQIFQGLLETKMALLGKSIEGLLDLPEMKSEKELAKMSILFNATSAAYHAAPDLFPLIVFRQVILSVKYGNAPLSVYAYATYGVILCGAVGDIESGYKFGKLALNLLELLGAEKHKAKTYFVEASVVRHWKEHIRKTLPPLKIGFQKGLETGDIEYTSYSGHTHTAYSYWAGRNLKEIDLEAARYSQTIAQLKQEHLHNLIICYHQAVKNLLGNASDPCLLIGEVYNEEKMIPKLKDANDGLAIFLLYLNKLQLCYLFGNYNQAYENSKAAYKYLDCALSTVQIPVFYFYDSLTRVALLPESSMQDKLSHKLSITMNQRKMKKWAEFAPENYLHKYLLIEAELAKYNGRFFEALDLYKEASLEAKKNKFLQDEALANELMANFYFVTEQEIPAKAYLGNASYLYSKWDAQAKVDQLNQKYKGLLSKTTVPLLKEQEDIEEKSKVSTDNLKQAIQFKTPLTTKQTEISLSTSISSTSETLDLNSVMKASQAISKEIVLDRLMKKLMDTVIENAGAQKGFLILTKDNKLMIGCHVTVDNEQKIQNSDIKEISVDQCDELSSAIVNYVTRTKEKIVLNDAQSEGMFTHDSYIMKNKPLSILCMPIIHLGNLTGALYLENNQTTGAFTPDRVKVLQILSSQAAISIQNATLYSNLEENKKYIENIIKSMIDSLIVVDSEAKIKTVNKSTQDLLGYSEDELIGNDFKMLISDSNTNEPDDKDKDESQDNNKLPEIIEKLINEKTVHNFEMNFQTKDDVDIPISLSGSVMTDSNNKLQSIVGIARDMRELKEAIAQLVQSEKLAALGELTASVAHELKQPLNVINIISQSLLMDIKKNRVHEEELELDLADVVSQVNKMAEIIDHMRIFSRRSDSKLSEKVDVNELIESSLKLYTQQLVNHDIDLIKNFDTENNPTVIGDAIRLEQILMNLISNARRAVDQSTKDQKEIEIKTYILSKEESSLGLESVVMAVRDNGPGIDKKVENKIFDQFFTTTVPGQGTGLGLSISRKIADEHDGKIEFDNKVGEGVTFKVILPSSSAAKI